MKRLSGVLIVVGVAGVWAYGVTSHLYYLIGGIALGALGLSTSPGTLTRRPGRPVAGARSALNLFGFAARSFDHEAEAIGAMLATHAAIALIAANRQHQFESALASSDIIGQAKGVIIQRYEVNAVRAFELLTRMSQNGNLSVSEIAQEVVARASGRRS